MSAEEFLSHVREADGLEPAMQILSETEPPGEAFVQATLREQLLPLLKEKGASAPGKIADGWFARAPHDDHQDDLRGQHIQLLDPEPWSGDDAMSGAQLLAEAESLIRRFVFVPDEDVYPVLAGWALYTWTFDLYSFTPYLWITAPQKRSGKSRLQDVLALLCRRSLSTANASVSTLFRVVEARTPTLFIDEVDTWLQDNEEARGILDSGFEEGKGVLRMVPLPTGEYDTRLFPTYSPKCITGIGAIDTTLADRSLKVPMRRKLPSEPVDRFNRRARSHVEVQTARWRRHALRWRLDHEDELAGVEPDLPAALHDRAQDIVEPLLAVADVVGGDWSRRIRVGIVKLFDVDDDGDDASILLLQDLAAIFAERKVTELPSLTIVSDLCLLTDRPWLRWGAKGTKALTQHGLARLLKPYDVRSVKIGPPEKRVQGYRLPGALQDAIDRYAGGGPTDDDDPPVQSLSESLSESDTAVERGPVQLSELNGPPAPVGVADPGDTQRPLDPLLQTGQVDRLQVDGPNELDSELDRERTTLADEVWFERERVVLDAMAENDLRLLEGDLTDEEWEEEIRDAMDRAELESVEREPEPELVNVRCPACGGFSYAMDQAQWACGECWLVFTP